MALVTLAAAVLGVLLVLSIWDTIAHGDEETRRGVAAEVLSCGPSDIVISGMRAEGCGRACSLKTTGSSATWWSSYTCVPEATARPEVSAHP